jgi:hypothetical protein
VPPQSLDPPPVPHPRGNVPVGRARGHADIQARPVGVVASRIPSARDEQVEDNRFVNTLDRMNEGLSGFVWDAFTAVGLNGVSGDYVEFGSWGCNTLRHVYQTREKFQAKLHLSAFDSFQGYRRPTIRVTSTPC